MLFRSELTSKCKKHKIAAMNAQRTCKKPKQSLTKVEQQQANCKSKSKCQCQSLPVGPPPDQPCYTEDEDPPLLARLYPELDAIHFDESETSSSDEDSEPTSVKAVQMRPITIRSSEVLNKGGDVKETRVQIDHIPLDAATLDRLSKEFKHPREMRLDFIDLIERKNETFTHCLTWG